MHLDLYVTIAQVEMKSYFQQESMLLRSQYWSNIQSPMYTHHIHKKSRISKLWFLFIMSQYSPNPNKSKIDNYTAKTSLDNQCELL